MPADAGPQPLADPAAPPRAADLAATFFIDAGHPAVRALVDRVTAGARDEREVATALFAAVRDEVRYDPYRMPVDDEHYRASAVLADGHGYCVQKAVVLTAVARAAGIPSRLGFADVCNHLQSERLREAMGTDQFLWHGYSTLFVSGRWIKASPAFNAELCARFGVPPLEFDGVHDALLHAFSGDGSRYMEYVHDHGAFEDLPLQRILAVYRATYPALAGRMPAA